MLLHRFYYIYFLLSLYLSQYGTGVAMMMMMIGVGCGSDRSIGWVVFGSGQKIVRVWWSGLVGSIDQ